MIRKLLIVSIIAFSSACTMNEPRAPGDIPAGTGFDTPEAAATALIQAAGNYDTTTLLDILGPDGKDLVASKDPVSDKAKASDFATMARAQHRVVIDSDDSSRATLVAGPDDWPMPIPLVKDHGKWRFDTRAGRDEILARRIGENELNAITVARGYVEAQKQYAAQLHDDSKVLQYAQRIISTPGKHDGLAWQNPDGSWGGPIGPEAAKAIEQGYTQKGAPYHGYYFKVLKGQGPAARLGQLDYMTGDAMIGGFGLAAWPADYRVTGVKSFIVSYDGVVYQKDLGQETPTAAAAMDRYNPDSTWVPTDDKW